jgi:hypothetical protein
MPLQLAIIMSYFIKFNYTNERKKRNNTLLNLQAIMEISIKHTDGRIEILYFLCTYQMGSVS